MKSYQITLLAVVLLLVFNSNSSCNDTNKNTASGNSKNTDSASDALLRNEKAPPGLSKKDYCGIYVADDWDKPVEDYVLKNPDVDGVIIRIRWNKIQPEENKFDWTQLDSDCKAIIGAGKKFWIAIPAGRHSPEWIYGHGVRKLTFREAPQEGKLGRMVEMVVPIVWDKAYIDLWENLITKVAEHLKADRVTWDALTMIKVSGINQKTDETRLPSQNELKDTKGRTSSNAANIWKNAGYRPALIKQTWQYILDAFAKNFPGKVLSMGIIPGHAFPTINEKGEIVKRNQAHDLNEDLIEYGLSKYKGIFAVQYNSLKEEGGDRGLEEVARAGKKGAITGLELEYVTLGEPPCLETHSPCDENMFKKVMDKGIDIGVCWIEIFPKNVLAFPKAIKYAHNKLME